MNPNKLNVRLQWIWDMRKRWERFFFSESAFSRKMQKNEKWLEFLRGSDHAFYIQNWWKEFHARHSNSQILHIYPGIFCSHNPVTKWANPSISQPSRNFISKASFYVALLCSYIDCSYLANVFYISFKLSMVEVYSLRSFHPDWVSFSVSNEADETELTAKTSGKSTKKKYTREIRSHTLNAYHHLHRDRLAIYHMGNFRSVKY